MQICHRSTQTSLCFFLNKDEFLNGMVEMIVRFLYRINKNWKLDGLELQKYCDVDMATKNKIYSIKEMVEKIISFGYVVIN